jgi:hypothetical protein
MSASSVVTVLRRSNVTGLFGRSRTGGYCVLRFPDSTETRWFPRVPTVGARLRSRGSGTGSRTWVVEEVLQSGRDTYTVFLVSQADYVEAQRSRPDRGPDLFDELLDLARRAGDSVAERRRRWRSRNELP